MYSLIMLDASFGAMYCILSALIISIRPYKFTTQSDELRMRGLGTASSAQNIKRWAM